MASNFLDSGQLKIAAGAQGAASTKSLPEVIGSIVGIVFWAAGVLLFGYLLYAGFLWMTAGGDEGQVKKAKDHIRNAVIGLVIMAASFAVTAFVLKNLTNVVSR